MTAFMCSDAHFDTLATYASQARLDLRLKVGTPAEARCAEMFGGKRPTFMEHVSDYRVAPMHERPDMIGAVLRDENARSVEYRYEDCKTSNDMGTKDYYRFRERAPKGPKQILQAVRCLDYQSCETPDWHDTLAFAILAAIKESAIADLCEGEPWGIEEARAVA